jgi:RNA polymerase sigma factor for flagellar operon FliA
MTVAVKAHESVENAEAGAEAGLEQRNVLVLEQLPQVYYIAARILERLPQHVELEDLVNAGVIGLLEACHSFDSSLNAQFKTFAKFRIRGAILDSLRMLDWGSRGLRHKAREITVVTSRLEGSLGRQPDKEEIAKEMRLTLIQLDGAMTQLQGLHIVQQTESFDGEEVHDVMEGTPSSWENPFELYRRAEEKGQLAAAVAELSERQQLILALHYVEELTIKEVAAVVGVSISRVSQIHFAALDKLKNALSHLQLKSSERPATPRQRDLPFGSPRGCG